MAQVAITLENGQIVVEWVGGENLRMKSFSALNVSTAPPEKIYLYEQGKYSCTLTYSQINTIDGVSPSDYEDAVDKIIALIPTAGGGGGGTNYNAVTAYDTVGDLPITFAAGTIHAISILCITGTLTVTINGEETEMIAGQNSDIEATTTIADEIVIEASTGTFLVNTIS